MLRRGNARSVTRAWPIKKGKVKQIALTSRNDALDTRQTYEWVQIRRLDVLTSFLVSFQVC